MSLNALSIPARPPLSVPETNRLICKAQNGDLDSRDEVVQANLRLVVSVAKRFVGFGYELDDLFQIGCLGLFKAINRFDTERGLMFSTYAVPLIIGEIRSFIRDDGPVKVSRGLKERYIKVDAIRQRFLTEHGIEPTLAELATLSGFTAEEIVAVLDSGSQPVSLDETVYAKEGRAVTRQDTIAVTEDKLEYITDKLTLAKALQGLNERERQILLLRYVDNWSQTKIAERFGISQVHVSRLLRKALTEAQQALES